MINRSLQSDNELLRLLRQGDKGAYTLLYKRYWQDLYNSAFKRLRNKEQCQDIVQTVFSDIWRRREKVLIEDLPPYLHTAVRFQVFKQLSRNPSPSEFLDDFEFLLTSPVQADDALLEKEILELVTLWIDALPQKRRTIFLMHINEGLSTREISAQLGITQKTVQNQLHTAVTTLRARLTQILSVFVIASFYFY